MELKTYPPSASPAVSVGQASKEPYAPDFEIFWTAYPRKKEKLDAFKAWRTRTREGVTADELLAAAKAYASECRRLGTQDRFIKHAATFLGPSKPFTDYLGPALPEGEVPPEVEAELNVLFKTSREEAACAKNSR